MLDLEQELASKKDKNIVAVLALPCKTSFMISMVYFQVILLLVILVMRKRLALVVALFHEAGKCIGSMPLLLIQPLWTFLILMVFFAYWIVVLGNLATAGVVFKYSLNSLTFKLKISLTFTE